MSTASVPGETDASAPGSHQGADGTGSGRWAGPVLGRRGDDAFGADRLLTDRSERPHRAV